jgi:glycosyltransferase involved in cell wall biosynthesis
MIQADVYHALCTGYACLYLALCKIKTGQRCLLTEHGIYTNERKIEITAAEWLLDRKAMSLDIRRNRHDRDLKDFWIDTFSGYSRLAYEAADAIVTLYEGNTQFQISDGAPIDKIRLIPNGVDVERYQAIPKKRGGSAAIALIGRVVPIKDVKTFLRACLDLKKRIPDIKAYVLGPVDEDPDYYQECVTLVKKCGLEEQVEFTGKVNLETWLPKIDVVVLTSISEAQPLVLLEAGACGIPSVATDVGSCREILYGRHDEEPFLGRGGVIVPLSEPQAVAKGVGDLLSDPEKYEACSKAIQARVQKYYHRMDQAKAYRELYFQMELV